MIVVGPVLVRGPDVLNLVAIAVLLTYSAGFGFGSKCCGGISHPAVPYLSATFANGSDVRVSKGVVAFLAVKASATVQSDVSPVSQKYVISPRNSKIC